MTQPIMEVGRWAVLRNGLVIGTLRMNPDSVYQWACGDNTYTDAGKFIASRTLPHDDDIIKTFPTRAEAEAYARNISTVADRPGLRTTGFIPGADTVAAWGAIVDVAPAPAVDWEQRRWDAALAALNLAGVNSYSYSGVGHLALECVKVADALVAAMKGETPCPQIATGA